LQLSHTLALFALGAVAFRGTDSRYSSAPTVAAQSVRMLKPVITSVTVRPKLETKNYIPVSITVADVLPPFAVVRVRASSRRGTSPRGRPTTICNVLLQDDEIKYGGLYDRGDRAPHRPSRELDGDYTLWTWRSLEVEKPRRRIRSTSGSGIAQTARRGFA
jgi:hypothetical protein